MMTQAAIEKLVSDRVAAALAQDRATRENTNGAGGPGGNIGGNAQGQGGAPPARECTYSSFIKCNPTSFHGNEGAVELSRWFEKTESVFSISECAERNKVKFAAATLQGRALTWWNSQVATLGLEVVNAKSWNDMKIMMREEFCPPEEIQRMEVELWNLRVKDSNIAAYTQRFNELVLLCPEMVPSEKKKVEAYVRGLPENIKGETTSSRPYFLSLNRACRIMLSKRRIQTNPQPTLTREAADQLVREGIEAALSAKRERVRMEDTRDGGPAGGLAAAPIKSVFGISECAERRLDVVNGKSWTDMRKMMMEEFCPDEELALLCSEAIPTKKKKVQLYIKGLPENIKGETTSSRPTVLNEAVRMDHTLMEQKLQAKAERISEGNKRK
ncbi:putative reverse transcriptase domain-containing protein [Tanacetum coccineum]